MSTKSEKFVDTFVDNVDKTPFRLLISSVSLMFSEIFVDIVTSHCRPAQNAPRAVSAAFVDAL